MEPVVGLVTANTTKQRATNALVKPLKSLTVNQTDALISYVIVKLTAQHLARNKTSVHVRILRFLTDILFFLAGENLGALDPDCDCEVLKCANECVGWGDWTLWGPWMPECIDSNGGDEDTIFDDQDIHQPKRFRSRDCFVKDETGNLTSEEVPVSKSFGECLFNDKFETEFLEEPPECVEDVILPEGEIETKVV